MKIALVHDQLNEFGGAERVLLAMRRLWPEAPIYTAYMVKGSPAWEHFKDTDVRTSWVQYIPFFASRLASPLRFLAPMIWNSFDFSGYDIILSSSSWYVTKGFANKGCATEVCYCHTPPRWLYGYPTSVDWKKSPIVRLYAVIVGFFMRQYDFTAARRVDYFIANSKETARRIQKFYRRESTVIYPPIDMPDVDSSRLTVHGSRSYYLFVSRPVGSKGFELAVEAARKHGFHLKIVGRSGTGEKNIEFLGRVSDGELAILYAGAKAFLALATDEDFGMTPVEAMSKGTPVIGFAGGGYTESVTDGKTGVLFDEPTTDGLIGAMRKFENIRRDWKKDCIAQAKKFSIDRFMVELDRFIQKVSEERAGDRTGRS